MAISLSTPDKLEYQFYPAALGQIQFRVRAANDAHVALTTGSHDGEPIWEVFIGGWQNTKSVVRKNKDRNSDTEAITPGILNPDEHRGFWIRWNDGCLTVGKEGEHSPFLDVHDPEVEVINHFGVCTGWGASGDWNIEDPSAPSAPSAAPAELSMQSLCWCDASGGVIPPGAVEGGRDEEPLYVGRANHEGALIPGKVKPSHGVCYVAWGGGEHGKSEYQVLCGCRPRWEPTSGSNVPSNAIPSGQTEDGEPLFVGRVQHEGTITLGKVQPSHNVCYIAYGGAEVGFDDYEIMVGE